MSNTPGVSVSYAKQELWGSSSIGAENRIRIQTLIKSDTY